MTDSGTNFRTDAGSDPIPLWTDIITDFDPDEETANFGTRHALESDGNIYEVVTLSTVEPRGEVTCRPNIQGRSLEEGLIMSVDSTLIFFSKDCQDVEYLVFDSPLTSLGVSECCRFAVCGTKSGNMEFIHIPTHRVMASIPLPGDLEDRSLISADIIGAPDFSKLVLMSKDMVHLFDGVDLDHLHSSILSADIESLRAAQTKMKLQSFEHDLEVNASVVCSDMFNNTIILVAHSGGLATMVLHLEDSTARVIDQLDKEAFDEEDVVRMIMNKDKTRIYCVDSSGRLHIICYLTFTIIQSFSEVHIQEFILLEEEEALASQFLIILQDPSGDSYLEMRSVRAFQLNYRLKVSGFCIPLHHHQSQECMTVVEGTSDSVLKVRGITEGVPEVRLERILRRGKFEEAEKFAESFGLSKEDIHKRKVAWLMDKLSPWNLTSSPQENEKLFEDLKGSLDKIEDIDFVMECCGMAALSTIHMTRNLLVFAREKIGKLDHDGELNKRHMLDIGRAMHRLETYVLTQSEVGSVEEWIEFSRVNMLVKIKKVMEQGALHTALLIWLRHQSELKDELLSEEILAILQCIPNQSTLEMKLQFLKQFIPDILELNPSSLPLLASWTLDTVHHLELDRKHWPQNGLTFAEQVLQSFQFGESDDYNQSMTMITLNQQRSDKDSSLVNLIHIVHILKDLEQLKSKFRIRIKLSDFMNENKPQVVASILDWVLAAEEIPALMTEFLTGFMHKHHLNQNTVLMEYIVNLLGNTGYTWHWHSGAAPWEEKVVKLLPFISSTEEKARVVLEAVKQAPVPWSQDVTDICQIGCELQHSSAVEIKVQKSLVSVKTILRKYEIKTLLTHGREADRMLLYIMHKGGVQGYEDALEICKVLGTKSVLEVTKLYLDQLIETSFDTQVALQKIQSVHESCPDEGLELCRYVVDKSALAIGFQISKEVETAYSQVLSSLVTSLLTEDESGEYQEKARLLLNAVTLKNNHGIVTREADNFGVAHSIIDMDSNKKLLKDYLARNLKARPDMANLTQATTCKPEQVAENESVKCLPECGVKLEDVLKICHLLNLPQEEGIARYMLELNLGGWYQESLEAGNILMQSSLNADLANSIFSVVYNTERAISQAGQKDDLGNLPELLSTLTSHCLVECEESAILDSLELFNWQTLMARINEESHNRRAYSAASSAMADEFDEWKFGSFYKDKGLPLEREDLLPSLFKNMSSILPLVEEAPYPYLPRNVCTSVEVSNLDVTCPDLETSGSGIDYRELSSDLHQGTLPLVQSLQMSGHGLLALQALELLEGCLDSLLCVTDPEFQGRTQKSLKDVGNGLSCQLMQRILVDLHSDPKLCLGIMSSLDCRLGLGQMAKINAGLGHDFRRICNLASVGNQYCRITQLPKQADQFLELFVRSSWGKRSTQLNIPFKDAFAGSVRDRMTALEKIVLHPKMEVDLLLQYAKAFQIEVDQALCLMSSALIQSMEPVLSQEDKIVQRDLSKVKEVLKRSWELFTRREACHQYLVTELSKVSPYNYEGLEFVIQGIQLTGEDRKAVHDIVGTASRTLSFLMQYDRVSSPHPELEVDTWLKEHNSSFPRLGSKRLPLHGILNLTKKEKCKLLEKEFTLDTYKSWLLVSEFVGVSVKNICSYTVTNTVTNILETDKVAGVKDEWIISHNNKCVLDQLNECILEMKNPENGNACSNWIVNRLPRGADKVLAARCNLRMAEIWMERNPNDEQCKLSLAIAKKTKDQLETEQVLYQYNLAEPRYLECMEQNNPTELIHRLYEDPRIITRSKVAAGDYPDFAKAAELISKINGMKHSAIKYSLVDKWLPQSGGCLAANETLSDFNINLNGNPGGDDGGDNKEDSENLLRCIYVLQDGAGETVTYLMNISMCDDPMVSTTHKLRALKCLFSIFAEEDLNKISGKDATQLKNYMKDLVFISRMEKLNLPVNIQSFQTCNKTNLVEGIWRTCKHSKEGIVLVRDLCSQFNIWNTNLWSSLLAQIIKFGFLKELEKTLLLLCNQPQTWICAQFLPAWNLLLQSPFSSLLPPVSGDQEAMCREILGLVHHCPTVMDLEVDKLVEECVRTQLPHLALILVPYLTKEKGEEVHEHVANQLSDEELRYKLDKLRLGAFVRTKLPGGGQLDKQHDTPTTFTSPAL